MQEEQYVIFILGQEEYGLPVQVVREINKFTTIRGIPNASEEIEGIINLRGTVIPVINLAKQFRLGDIDVRKNASIAVIEVNDRLLGLLVDTVTEVLKIPVEAVELPPDLVKGNEFNFISGIAKVKDRLITLLKPEKMFTYEEIEDLSKVSTAY